jgi:hypothetical protein
LTRAGQTPVIMSEGGFLKVRPGPIHDRLGSAAEPR